MEVLVVLGLVVGGVVLLGNLARWSTGRSPQWRDDARNHLERLLDDVRSVSTTRFQGRAKGRTVLVDTAAQPGAFTIWMPLRKGLLRGLSSEGQGDPVVTGDPVLDRQPGLWGDPLTALSLCSDAGRAALRELGPSGVTVREAGLWTTVPIIDVGGSAGPRIGRMLQAAQVLEAEPADRDERLARVALESSGRDVRLAAVRALVARRGDAPVTARVLDALATEVDGELRLLALRARGGVDGVAEMVRSPALAPHWRVEALRLLDERGGRAAAAPLVRLALNSRQTALVEAATELIRQDGPAVDPAVREALRKSLDDAGGLALLWKLQALGACGTADDFAVLAPWLEHSEAGVRDVASSARKRLLERLGPRDQGALSVVEPGEEGGLSLADGAGEPGRLEVVEDRE